jgi:hypothetical protein
MGHMSVATRAELEEEFFQVEGRPVDYGPMIESLEAERAVLDEAIARLQRLQAMGTGRKGPQRVKGIAG